MSEEYKSIVGDWNKLTDNERYELALSFAEGYQWDETHGWYDYIDENSREEKAWDEYKREEAKFMTEALNYYNTHIKCLSEFRISEMIRMIFHYNDDLLSLFLKRLRDNNMVGARIIAEVQTIIAVQQEEDCHHELINSEMVLEPLRKELESLGFNTKKKGNWSAGFGNKHSKIVEENISIYRVFIKRNQ